MSTLTRAQLLQLFDIRREVGFAQNPHTHIVRRMDDEQQKPMVHKTYSGLLSELQVREYDLLFNVGLQSFGGTPLASRVATLRKFTAQTAMGSHEIAVKWYGFDLDDWARLLQLTQPNPLHQAGTLLALVGATLKALRLMHGASFVHNDVHDGNLCLPFQSAKVNPNGQFIECTVALDELKLIDLGWSLKKPDERGPVPTPRLNEKAGHPPRLLFAQKQALAGKPQAWLELDWRLDLYRLGKRLNDVWMVNANAANGLVGPEAQRTLLEDLVEELQRPERERTSGATVYSPPDTLLHNELIDRIDAALESDDPKQIWYVRLLDGEEIPRFLCRHPKMIAVKSLGLEVSIDPITEQDFEFQQSENDARPKVGCTPLQIENYLSHLNALERQTATLRQLADSTFRKSFFGFRLLTQEEWISVCLAGFDGCHPYVIEDRQVRDGELTSQDAVFRWSSMPIGTHTEQSIYSAPTHAHSVSDSRNRINRWGVRGMHGNVWELVIKGLTAKGDAHTVACGGAFDSQPEDLRWDHFRELDRVQSQSVGFRVCRAL
jgi:hypothetical protein